MKGQVCLFTGHVARITNGTLLAVIGTAMLLSGQTVDPTFRNGATDPGPRGGPAAAGKPIGGLIGNEITAFTTTKETFQEVDSVKGTLEDGKGLGPRFNLDSCAGCHAQPDVGGSSPAINPQIAVARKAGALNTIPSFLSLNGPIREARFVKTSSGAPDGGVAALFTIRGRSDAQGCNISQPDFAGAVASKNVIFRIPTPVFGAGLIEAIDDSTILANKSASSDHKSRLGISGRENRSGNDGTITRFGWKAQNKSLMIFAGEAYNVEQGVTNEMFMQERDSAPSCRFNPSPEDHMDVDSTKVVEGGGDLAQFAMFMRFLAPPDRGPINNSVTNGASQFNSIGCSMCHTPTLQTSSHPVKALTNIAANLYSDLLLHNMGTELADGVSQGSANGNEFRTAPLWGLGQRLFFLHDGRTGNLISAIQSHSSSGSEANQVVDNYNSLSSSQKQDILNFLRSL